MMLPGTTDNERALNSDTSSIMRDGGEEDVSTVSRSIVMPFAETQDFVARKHLTPTWSRAVSENIYIPSIRYAIFA